MHCAVDWWWTQCNVMKSTVHCAQCTVHCAQCTVDWWWWARWALTRSPPCQKCHTPSYPFPNTPLLPVHSVHTRVHSVQSSSHSSDSWQDGVAAEGAGLSSPPFTPSPPLSAYLLPLPTIYYLLDKSSSEEGKKVMDSVTCMMPAPEYIVGTCVG